MSAIAKNRPGSLREDALEKARRTVGFWCEPEELAAACISPDGYDEVIRAALDSPFAGAGDFAAGCAGLDLFGSFHRGECSGIDILLGDYFYAMFLSSVAPIGKKELTDAFAKYLKNNIGGSLADFIGSLGMPAAGS